jgi:hypothetical protein
MVLGIAMLPVLPNDAASQAQPAPPLKVNGDFRSGYFNLQREDRDGSRVTTDDYRARLRIGVGLELSEDVAARVRFAGRFSTAQEKVTFYLRKHPPSADGLRLGELTIDEAYLNYHRIPRLNLRVGRMQTKFALADLMEKSLDRVDSPNTDITWTDGAHLTVTAPHGWSTHLILQHNPAGGSTNQMRAPLSFDASSSRVSYFGAVQNTTAWGPIIQRSLDLTYVPAALPAAGDASGQVEDYLAVAGRAAIEVPVFGARILLGGEAGYAPNTPSREAMQLGAAGSRDVGGFAYQIGATLSDTVRRHRFGLVYGYAEAGWLIAPDFRNNDRLLEARYYRAFARNRAVDARIRQRQDIEQFMTAEHKREDVDVYVRFTWRF